MNPYQSLWMPKQPDPPVVMTVQRSKEINAQFDKEESSILDDRARFQEKLTAMLDVMGQQYPHLAGDFEDLSATAQGVGQCDGKKWCGNAQQGQFNSALPKEIKDALAAEKKQSS